MLKDDTTTFATITGTTNATGSAGGGQYIDASGVLRTTDALWIANNATIQRTFTTNKFVLTCAGAGTTATILSYVSIEAQAPSGLAGTIDLDAILASGSMASELPSTLTGSIDLEAILASGSMSMQPGVATVQQLRNWSGTLLTSQLVEKIAVLRISDITLLATFTNQTSHVTTADLALTSPLLIPGTACMVVGFSPDGAQRFARPVTIV